MATDMAVDGPAEATVSPLTNSAIEPAGSPPTNDAIQSPFGGFYTPSQLAHHPEAASILRQAEFYFCDANLKQDAHLLGLAGGTGNERVRLSEILSFSKMRKFKMRAKVLATLQESLFLDVSPDKKWIKRRYPMEEPITVVPEVSTTRVQAQARQNYPSAATPWLTKNMLKPTGFEDNATEGPISPEQYEKDLRMYHPEDSILSRMEAAVANFNANRKMHQDTRAIFEGFTHFGGFYSSVQMFAGGVNAERKRLKEEGYDNEEIVQATSSYAIDERVKTAIYDEIEKKATSDWVVDFPGMAKAYFCMIFMPTFYWIDDEVVDTATRVLRNFYNFLLAHNVCPEYHGQLLAARAVCDQAAFELPKLAIVDRRLPGDFNSACSTLFGGTWAELHRPKDSEWGQGTDNMGLQTEDAVAILKAGLAAYGTDEQCETASKVLTGNGGKIQCTSQVSMGLEIVSMEPPSEYAMETYGPLSKLQGFEKFIHPMGKMVCKRWEVPATPPCDLPAHVTAKYGNGEALTFLIEAETLKFCVPGMKMEAVVMELDIGVQFIDSVEKMWPSFYMYVPNEAVLEWKEPSDPKDWMKRQTAKKNGTAVAPVDEETAAAAENDGEDEEGTFSDEDWD